MTWERAASQLGTTHLDTPTSPNGTPVERISQYQCQRNNRHAALEQKRCAVYDFPHPPSCRPPLNRERAAGVSRLATVVEPDSSPPRSDIDPHFYLRQIFDRSNTKNSHRLSVGNHTIIALTTPTPPRRVQGGGARFRYFLLAVWTVTLQMVPTLTCPPRTAHGALSFPPGLPTALWAVPPDHARLFGQSP